MSDYFQQMPNTTQPIVPPAPPPPPVPQPVTAEATAQASAPTPVVPTSNEEFIGLPVRAMGDRIFLLKGGVKYWIGSPEAMAALGFKIGDEVRIDQATLDALPEGEPIR